MNGVEPTEQEIEQYMKENPGETWYTAREKLRDKSYSGKYKKPEHMSWGDFWKSY